MRPGLAGAVRVPDREVGVCMNGSGGGALCLTRTLTNDAVSSDRRALQPIKSR